jgi:hypothetical protein
MRLNRVEIVGDEIWQTFLSWAPLCFILGPLGFWDKKLGRRQ